MFKDKLKELRHKENISQAMLAEKIFVSRSAVAKWEQGRGLPTQDSLDLLCKFFNIGEEELLDKKEPLLICSSLQVENNKKNIVIKILIAFIIFALIGFIIASCNYNNYKNRYNNFSHKNIAYEREVIALNLNESYQLEVSELTKDSSFIYDKYEIIPSEDNNFIVENNKITTLKTGIYDVSINLYNHSDKQIAYATLLKIYCYNQEELIKINNVDDLIAMNSNKNGWYMLNNNLDLKEIKSFEPIGNYPYGNEFSGILINPNNYVISNLTISTASEIYHGPYGGCVGGLFGNARYAFIDNIMLENVNIDISDFESESHTSQSVAGGLVGSAFNCLITNCKVSGNIKAQYAVGGLCGISDYTTIENCIFNGNVIQENDNNYTTSAAGGISGYLYMIKVFGIKLCEVNNNIVNANIKSNYVAGKLAGYIYGDSYENNNMICQLQANETYEFGKTDQEYE